MELIDTITIRHQHTDHSVMLFAGDLTSLPAHEAVDALIVSAFPDDYTPTATSLIGSLARAGVSVGTLAQAKEVDLRQFSSCWLSHPIERPDLHFRRILCFEPEHPGKAAEVVGDIFRSLVPISTGVPPIRQIAMPLVASGDQGEPAELMLESLTDAAVHWLLLGLPLDGIKIVIQKPADSPSLREAFATVKRRHAHACVAHQQNFSFDAFVSYSHNNKHEVDKLVGAMQSLRPGLRVFVDRLELRPGAAWQQHIFESLEDSRKVICVLSPDYLASKVCKEEFNIAWFRHRETESGVLLPVYLRSADLPTFMKLFQYEDVREADHLKIVQSANNLLLQL